MEEAALALTLSGERALEEAGGTWAKVWKPKAQGTFGDLMGTEEANARRGHGCAGVGCSYNPRECPSYHSHSTFVAIPTTFWPLAVKCLKEETIFLMGTELFL